MAKRGISKWQMKSARVNQMRWELELLLHDDLSEQEKQSDSYKELVESVEIAYLHAIPTSIKMRSPPQPNLIEKGIEEEKNDEKSEKRNWKVTLLISLATVSGAVLQKVIEFVIDWLSKVHTGGSP
jgi:hypothetical protein